MPTLGTLVTIGIFLITGLIAYIRGITRISIILDEVKQSTEELKQSASQLRVAVSVLDKTVAVMAKDVERIDDVDKRLKVVETFSRLG